MHIDWNAQHGRQRNEVAAFDRGSERFRTSFQLARRLLRGSGHALGAGDANTFVFLVSMEKVFEDYVAAVLRAHYAVNIETQKVVGYLLSELTNGRLQQKADYFWTAHNETFIGDAKYKHLAKAQNTPLRFEDLPEDESESLAGRVLCASDVRQLGVYAELSRRDKSAPLDNFYCHIFYPFVGSGELRCASTQLWNGATLSLVPVVPFRRLRLAECMAASEQNVLFQS